MTSIKWGILGTGSIAKAFADALQETEGELVAVASQSLKRAEDFSKPYNCSAVEGYKSLISLPEVEAIYIATPHPSHFELSAECLRNKKAVLCEKPCLLYTSDAADD